MHKPHNRIVILYTLHRVYAEHIGVQSIEALREDIQGALDTSPTGEDIGCCVNAILGGIFNKKNKKAKVKDDSKQGKSRR